MLTAEPKLCPATIERCGPRTALVVNASVTESASIVDGLRRSRIDATCSYDGDAGLDDAIHLEPDVIVIDLAIPGLDAESLIERLAHLDGTRDTPILLLADRERLRSPDDLACFGGVRRLIYRPLRIERVVSSVTRIARPR